jgi:hypothetical protein
MADNDGPEIAQLFYKELFKRPIISVDSVAFALDHAVTALRQRGIPPERWATFIHMGA